MRKVQEAPINQDFPKETAELKFCKECKYQLETALVMIEEGNARTYMRGYHCPTCDIYYAD